jgi:hypothetical protein
VAVLRRSCALFAACLWRIVNSLKVKKSPFGSHILVVNPALLRHLYRITRMDVVLPVTRTIK